MIEQLSLQNFKSWRSVPAMRLAPITGLFGANSSGKSSLLQAILVLKQTVESSDRAQVLNLGDDRTMVSLGTFGDLAFGHDSRQAMQMGLTWRPMNAVRLDLGRMGDSYPEADRLSFETMLRVSDVHGPVVERFDYGTDGLVFGMRRSADRKYELTADTGELNFRFVRALGRKWNLPPPVKCYGFPDQVRTYYQNAGFLQDFEREFQDLVGRIFYLGPLREPPKRQYTWAGGSPSDVGWRGEQTAEALLASQARGRSNSRGRRKRHITVEEHVAAWLKQLDLITSFEVETIGTSANLYRVMVRKTPTSERVVLTDVGFGVSQVLPALTLLAYVPAGSVVILEQPEIHLHPAVQSGLADIIIEAAKVRQVQVIVESHSEHLLLRLQRRLAEGAKDLRLSDLALYFCHFDGKQSNLESLELTATGDIVNWPDDFFGDPFGERAAMIEAISRRHGGA